MKLFITGGTGMVGCNLCNLANKQGYQVIAPTRAELDLTNLTSIVTYLQNTKPDIVIHCAGLVGGIKANMDAQYDFCYQNLLLGMNVIQAAYQSGITRLINLGSSCMYPKNAENPIKESQLLQGLPEPTNHGYAIAKNAVACLAKYLSWEYGFQCKTLIPNNIYGYWENHGVNKSHMISSAIKKIDQAINKQQSNVVIWGDGTPRREAIFAEDLADFIIFTLQNFDAIPSVINVGSGVDYTINQYYQIIAKVLGYTGTFSYDLTKPNGVQQKLLDTSKLKSLGWQLKTSLEDGIRKTYKFYKEEVVECCL